MKFFASLLVIGLLLSGCGSDSASSGSQITTSLSTVNSKLNAAASVLDATSISSVSVPARTDYVTARSASLHTVWDTAGAIADMYNAGNYSLKEWFVDEFNPNFTNSDGAKTTVVGRIASSMNLLCFVGRLATSVDSTNLPPAGSYPLTITAAVATACGDTGASGQTVTMTVTDTTDTTLYDKNFSVDMGNACPFLFKVRMNTTEINIATSEDQSCDSRDQASAAVVQYNRATDVMRFTYISQNFSGTVPSPAGFEFYRGIYNGTADTSYILGIYGSDDGSGAPGALGGVMYTVVGKPTAGGTAAVSVKTIDTAIDGDYNGCINSADLTAVAGDTLACDMTNPSTAAATLAGAITTAHSANSAIADIYNITESTAVGFTDQSDMF